MKISIVTAVRNDATTVGETLNSVAAQVGAEIEHIVIDGASTDGTVDVIRQHAARLAYFVSEPDRGPYDGMNKGIKVATGDAIGFLNGDDVFASPDVVARISEVLADDDVDACYANLDYTAADDLGKVVRRWRSQPYRPGLFLRGWMPAHPTFYVKRRVFERCGGFDLEFRRQADFDLALRFMHIHCIRTVFVPEVWVRMRMGGLSNHGFRNVLAGNIEAYRICRKRGVKVWPWFPVVKMASRLPQFLGRSG
jgi:glycosyltransferase involved in cell wall biosynthesis